MGEQNLELLRARMISRSCLEAAPCQRFVRSTLDAIAMAGPREIFLSVDIETSGPYPERYALLSIGACVVDDPEEGFYVELKPSPPLPEASGLYASALSSERRSRHGQEPRRAMLAMALWIRRVVPSDRRPIMVAFNATYDWPFINHYFHESVGDNPLGRGAIDIRAFYMGLRGCAWEETSMLYLSRLLQRVQERGQDALSDARLQAGLFRRLLADARRRESL
jgi:DNA polymerase III epsilon subunit-like protein